ncbi:hypothetical protein EYF80_036757 [Liparis tanakae]|uniref:Uncharacterized protein n=1 Tax=Liparis tanakae TaxID=230148 RepID=A0A4Z2GJT9_9TELE|nr:hypothetical protein EYF80_036757 [Liparis tanakae]
MHPGVQCLAHGHFDLQLMGRAGIDPLTPLSYSRPVMHEVFTLGMLNHRKLLWRARRCESRPSKNRQGSEVRSDAMSTDAMFQVCLLHLWSDHIPPHTSRLLQSSAHSQRVTRLVDRWEEMQVKVQPP